MRAAERAGERDVVGDLAAGGREEGGDSWDLGCSIHPSARLSRCVPGELGSWDRVVGRVIFVGGVKVAYMRVGRLLG